MWQSAVKASHDTAVHSNTEIVTSPSERSNVACSRLPHVFTMHVCFLHSISIGHNKGPRLCCTVLVLLLVFLCVLKFLYKFGWVQCRDLERTFRDKRTVRTLTHALFACICFCSWRRIVSAGFALFYLHILPYSGGFLVLDRLVSFYLFTLLIASCFYSHGNISFFSC